MDGVGHLTAYAGKPFFSARSPEASPKRHIFGRIWREMVVYVPVVLTDA